MNARKVAPWELAYCAAGRSAAAPKLWRAVVGVADMGKEGCLAGKSRAALAGEELCRSGGAGLAWLATKLAAGAENRGALH